MSDQVASTPSAAPAAAPAAGGEPASAPASDTAQNAPASDGKASRIARALAHGAKVSGSAPAAEAPKLGEKPATPGEAAKPAPPQPPAAPPPVVSSEAMQAALRAERAEWETRQRLKALEDENKAFKEAAEKRKGLTPLQILEMEGTTLDSVHEKIVKGEYKPKTAEQLAIERQENDLKELRAWREAQENERKESAKNAERQSQASQLQKELSEKYSKQYPLLSADPDAGMQLVHLKEQHPDASWDQVAAHLEQERAKTVRHTFVSDAAIDSLLADPDLKARLLSKLGGANKSELQPQQANEGPRTGNGPDAIPSARAAEGSRVVTPRVGGTAGRQAAVLAAVEKRRASSMG